ncbi:hypothetical protein ACFLZB_04820 [Nanoarchaeota archaeon]
MANGVSPEFANIIKEFEFYGIFDVLIPFILVFTIVFAILQRIKLFGSDKKNINLVLAFIMGVVTVIPHVTGSYPGKYDPVVIINALLPSVSVLIIAIILVLLLVGMFAGEWGAEKASGIVFIIALMFIAYVFGTTVGWWSGPAELFGSWWGETLTIVVVIILILGVLLFYIGSDHKSPGNRIGDVIKNLFKGGSP